VVAIADDELPRRGPYLCNARRQFADREEQAVRKPRQLVLPGLPHVDEQRPFAAGEPARKIVDGDFPRHRHTRNLGRDAAYRSRLRMVLRTVS